MSAHKPLEGVKVVELASFVAAPTAGRMMAEMGADVIRVESTAGDPWRFYGANCGLPITDEENPLFDIYNLGKKDIQLNTKTPEGKEILFHRIPRVSGGEPRLGNPSKHTCKYSPRERG